MPLPSPLISQKVSEQNFEIAILFSIAERQITLHLKMTRPSTASVEGSSSYEFCQFLCIVFVIGKCAFIFRVGGLIFEGNFYTGGICQNSFAKILEGGTDLIWSPMTTLTIITKGAKPSLSSMPLPSPLFSQKASEQNFEIAILFSIVERQIILHLEMTRPPPPPQPL